METVSGNTFARADALKTEQRTQYVRVTIRDKRCGANLPCKKSPINASLLSQFQSHLQKESPLLAEPLLWALTPCDMTGSQC